MLAAEKMKGRDETLSLRLVALPSLPPRPEAISVAHGKLREAQHRIKILAQAITVSPARQAEVGSIPASVSSSCKEPGGTASSERADSAPWQDGSLIHLIIATPFLGISFSPPDALSILQPSLGPAVLSSWPSPTPYLAHRAKSPPQSPGELWQLRSQPSHQHEVGTGWVPSSCRQPQAANLQLSPCQRWKGGHPGSGSPPAAWGPGVPGGSGHPQGGSPEEQGGRRGWGLPWGWSVVTAGM